jgi:hypothetical protein
MRRKTGQKWQNKTNYKQNGKKKYADEDKLNKRKHEEKKKTQKRLDWERMRRRNNFCLTFPKSKPKQFTQSHVEGI